MTTVAVSIPDGARLLQDALTRRGWSQRKLARKVGTTPATVCRWVKGVRCPNRKHAGKLHELLGLASSVWD